MLLEELFARMDGKHRPEPADDAAPVIIGRLRELLDAQESKQSLPYRNTGTAEK